MHANTVSQATIETCEHGQPLAANPDAHVQDGCRARMRIRYTNERCNELQMASMATLRGQHAESGHARRLRI
eukprot:2930609-Alexandrium_andersonii.AAC.1